MHELRTRKKIVFVVIAFFAVISGYVGCWMLQEKRKIDFAFFPPVQPLASRPTSISDPLCDLVLGQSNVANHGYPLGRGTRNSYAFSTKGWFELIDPVVGGSGHRGSVWTRVALLALDCDLGDSFIAASAAQGSSKVDDRIPNGSHYPKVKSVIDALKSEYLDVDAVVYHQGETEAWSDKTYGRDYQRKRQRLIENLRFELPETSIVICVVSRDPDGRVNPEIRLAQKSVADTNSHVFQGPDTDSLEDDYRCDRVHFNEKGFERFASELVDVLGEIIQQAEAKSIRE